jgi:hypothetical protein
MHNMLILFIVFFFAGLVQALISIPMILRRVKPNYWYGFRTRKTLENEQVWYDVNEYSGKRLFISGILIMISAIVFAFIPNITIDLYSVLVLIVVTVTLGIGLTQSFRYLNQIAK